MQAVMKKPHTENEMITLRLRVHRDNAEKIKEYARNIESHEQKTYSVAEMFPECLGKEKQIALRAYRTRENLTQKELSKITGIPQHQISEMENGKRAVSEARARKLAKALNAYDYRIFVWYGTPCIDTSGDFQR